MNRKPEDLSKIIADLLAKQEEIMKTYRKERRFALSTPEPKETKRAERRPEMDAKCCQECGEMTLLPAILGKGVVCISCGYTWFKANDFVSRLISRDTEADDNLEAGLIMALKVKG